MDEDYEASIRTEGSYGLMVPGEERQVSVEEIQQVGRLMRLLKERMFFVTSRNYSNSRISAGSLTTIENSCAVEIDNYILKLSFNLIKKKIVTHPFFSTYLWELSRERQGLTSKSALAQIKAIEEAREKILKLACELEEQATKERREFKYYLSTNKNAWKILPEIKQKIDEHKENNKENKDLKKLHKTKDLVRRLKRLGEIVQRIMLITPINYQKNPHMWNIQKRLQKIYSITM